MDLIVAENQSWDTVPPGSVFRTEFGAVYRRLSCGHFRNERPDDDDVAEERSVDWCWHGCHE